MLPGNIGISFKLLGRLRRNAEQKLNKQKCAPPKQLSTWELPISALMHRHTFLICTRITAIMNVHATKEMRTYTTRDYRQPDKNTVCRLGQKHHKYRCQSKKAGRTDALCPHTTHQLVILRRDTVATENKKKRQQNVLCTPRQRAHTTSLCRLTCRLSWVFEVHILQKRLAAVPKFEQKTEVLLRRDIQHPLFLQPSQVRTEVTGIEKPSSSAEPRASYIAKLLAVPKQHY